jgi:hypothetical protein
LDTPSTGNGAADLSIAVLVPEGRDLANDENYLPTIVQGVLVGDFTKFSSMRVLDRQNLDKIIAEGESGYYADENTFVQLGTLANVRYILNGAPQKTGSGFSLQLKVTEAASGVSRAAYTGSVTAAELEDLSGVKRASVDILTQLGVSLTNAEKAELLGAASASVVQAETALAKGITAQRSGTVVEALSYYYEAAQFDPSLAEAASRSSILSANIQGGNIGQNVRNDIQRRAAWVKVLEEAAAFFREHPPFELIYNPALTPGSIDYEKETVEMWFEAKLITTTTGFKVIGDLAQGLRRAMGTSTWRISVASIYNAIPRRYEITAELTNESGVLIGRTRGTFNIPSYPWHFFDDQDLALGFSGVDANKITDRLSVSIVSVNGMDAKTAGERGYLGISTEDLTALGGQFSIRWNSGGIVITDYNGPGGNLVIPARIGRWPVTIIYDRAFSGKDLTSVTIPGSVTSIRYLAFYNNPLASVTLPANVEVVNEDAIGNYFFRKYMENRRRAGTYTR